MDLLDVQLWKAAIYTLGAIGLFAIGGLPLRAYMLTRQNALVGHSAWVKPAIFLLFVIAAAFAFQLVAQIGRCLLGVHCSANVAGGWINSAFLGLIYACFETIAWLLRRAGRSRTVAT